MRRMNRREIKHYLLEKVAYHYPEVKLSRRKIKWYVDLVEEFGEQTDEGFLAALTIIEKNLD